MVRLGLLAVVLTGLMTPSLGGCALVIPQAFVTPSEVTLPVAFASIACGLKSYSNELSKLDLDPGTIVDQVDVTLVLKASATGTSTLVVDAKPSNVIPVGLNYTDKTEQIGTRDNTIKLTFKSIHTAALTENGKSAVKKDPKYFAASPRDQYWVDKPCNPTTDPVPVDSLLQANRDYRNGRR